MGSEVIYWRHLSSKNDLRPHFLLGGGRCARADREARDLRGDEARPQAAAREAFATRPSRSSNISAKQLRRASWLRARLQKQAHEVGEAKKRVDTYRAEWAVERDIARIVSGSDPIIVGPWLSEVGYEVLYWVPFVRWVQSQFRIAPERLVVVTRGGAASWYRTSRPTRWSCST